jgi:hypothetical protein
MTTVAYRALASCAWLLSAALLVLSAAAGRAGDAPATPAGDAPASTLMTWTDLTDQHSGWRHGISLAVMSGDGEALIVGMPDKGLWASVNAGKNWAQLGKDQPALMAGRPTQLIIDPSDPKSFWVGLRGPGGGVFSSIDGGVTITRLSTRDDLGAFGVDFTDPKRKTMFHSLFDKNVGIHRSVNNGKIFSRISGRLPDSILPFTSMVVLDAKTLLIASDFPGPVKAKGKERTTGILRSDDGGLGWSLVAKEGTQGAPLHLATGEILWPYGLDEGILRSADQGKTWTVLDNCVRSCPCDLGKGWLVAAGDRQLQISTNGGKIWQPLGPPAPFAPNGLVFDPKHHALFAYRSPEGVGSVSLARLDLPEDLTTVAQVVAVRDLMVWNGDEFAKGAGWMDPKGGPTLLPAITNTIVRQGKAALRLHGEAVNAASFGWNWFSWNPADGGTDVSGMKTLLLAIRVDGVVKPTVLRLSLNCSTGKVASKSVDLIALYPGLCDATWKEVAIPLEEFTTGSAFDPKKAWEIDIFVQAKTPLNNDIYLDEIGFAH